MKASVIIPSFRRATCLQDTIKSVVSQDDLDDYELIVVDNERSRTLWIEEYCKKVTSLERKNIHYVHEPQIGLHFARHAGAQAAKGEILIYIDDDVICSKNWLRNILRPFNVADVAIVAGRVALRYEADVPPWIAECSTYLSALEAGLISGPLPENGNPVGCNMAVRKSVLFSVGGFNPDGFGDPKSIVYRGDGENGLTRKVRLKRFQVWYSSDSLVHHRVPASRLTLTYARKRASMGGIEDAYSDIRYGNMSFLELTATMLRSIAAWLLHSSHAVLIKHRADSKWIRLTMRAARAKGRALQKLRQLIRPELQSYAKRASYLDRVEINKEERR